VLVTLTGLAFALVANMVSPRGLSLTTDYFPGATLPRSPLATEPTTVSQAASIEADPAADTGLASRIREVGLEVISSSEVVQLYNDPRYEEETILFVDARDDEHYQQGHIPSAYQLDHYRAENYLPDVLPMCLSAESIVVYCNGGDCEDSEFAAVLLRDAGIPVDRIRVYVAGFAEWTELGQPVEIGARNSGLSAQSP
jgi:rhodanese-related sulfurtransferase